MQFSASFVADQKYDDFIDVASVVICDVLSQSIVSSVAKIGDKSDVQVRILVISNFIFRNIICGVYAP